MVRSRGHLSAPDPQVRLDRFTLAPALDALVRHVWVGRWAVPVGETRVQRVLTYPAHNVVIEPAGASLVGPDPRLSTRELTGTGWVVGVLLRPAAGRVLTSTPARDLVARAEPVQAPLEAVRALLDRAPQAPPARDLDPECTAALTELLETWLAPYAAQADTDATGRLVNEACRLAEEGAVDRVGALADTLGVSTRTLERAVRSTTGVTPKWLLECRRLQEAAMTLLADPATDLTVLATDLGYADQAHLTRAFRRVLGQTPGQARAAAAATAARARG